MIPEHFFCINGLDGVSCSMPVSSSLEYGIYRSRVYRYLNAFKLFALAGSIKLITMVVTLAHSMVKGVIHCYPGPEFSPDRRLF